MREMAYAGARRLIWGLCEVYTALIRKYNSFCLFCVFGVYMVGETYNGRRWTMSGRFGAVWCGW